MNVKKQVLMLCGFLIPMSLFAQVGINTPTPQTSFEVRADTLNLSLPDGITPPKLTGDQLFKKNTAYGPNQAGAMIYLSAAPTSMSTEASGITMASDSGYYYYDGTQWQSFGNRVSDTASAWFSTSTNLASMSVNDTVYHLSPVGIGTSTPDSMLTVNGGATFLKHDILVNGITVGYGPANDEYTASLAVGTEALSNNFSGANNTAIGFHALFQNTSGGHNTALGTNSLGLNRSGNNNTALGAEALFGNITGSNNVAIGYNTISKNTTGSYNLAIGNNALSKNSNGSLNLAIGEKALSQSTTASVNLAMGYSALQSSIIGRFNVAIGSQSLTKSLSDNNMAIGVSAMNNNVSGAYNVAVGNEAGGKRITGDQNTSLGYRALFADTSGVNNVALGYEAGAGNGGSNNIFVGARTGNSDFTLVTEASLATPGDGNIFVGSYAGTGMSVPGGNVIIGSLDSNNSALDPTTANSIYLGTGGTADTIADGLLRMRIDSAGATQFYGTLSALSSIVATASADPLMADGITAPILSGDELFAKNGAYNAEQKGSMIYLSAAPTSTSTQGSGITMASDSGYYYFDGTQWQSFGNKVSDTASAWFSTSTNLASMSVNDTVYHLNPVGIGTDTPDSMLTVVGGARITNDIQVHTMTVGLGGGQGSTNTALGYQALDSNTTGKQNVAVGYQSLISNTTGLGNTAQGYLALTKLSSGVLNTAIGANSQGSITSGDLNTSIGASSLAIQTTGSRNTSIGYRAMAKSIAPQENTAIGVNSQESNISGGNNVSVGLSSLRFVDTGSYNVAIGDYSLTSTKGNANTALGYSAGYANDGFMNTFIGYSSGDSSGFPTPGNKNIFIGPGAGKGLSEEGGNVIIGALDATTLGVDVLGTQNAIYLGTGGQRSDSLADGILRMKIDSAGATQFYGSVTSISAFYSNSDRRLKTNIQDITLPENFIDLIKPVVYDKKSSMDATNYSFHEYGFIAQDIQKLFPSMVNKANDKDGTLSISYTQLIPVLTKVLQDQKKTIKEQEANISQQQADIDQLRKELNEIKAALMNK